MTRHDPWMATSRPSSILWVFAHRSASGWRIRRVACPTWVRTCQKKWMDQGLIWIPKLLERAQNSKRILSVRAFFSCLLCSFFIIWSRCLANMKVGQHIFLQSTIYSSPNVQLRTPNTTKGHKNTKRPPIQRETVTGGQNHLRCKIILHILNKNSRRRAWFWLILGYNLIQHESDCDDHNWTNSQSSGAIAYMHLTYSILHIYNHII